MPATQYYTATTIDGFIADADNSLDGLFAVGEGGTDAEPFTSFFGAVGAFAMGATTSERVLAHDDLPAHPDKWTGYYGDVPAWVFTHRTLPAIPGANLTFVQGDVRPVHAAMGPPPATATSGSSAAASWPAPSPTRVCSTSWCWVSPR